MHKRTYWLTALTLLCAALAIASAPWALNTPALNFVFKPLTTALIIVYAWRRGQDQAVQRRWVLVGLALSWCGDVALLWPQQGFLPGLVSFLLAHLAYLWAFTRQVRLARNATPFVGYVILAAAILWLLWPGVPAGLRWPVLAYVVGLGAMAAQAAVVWRRGAARGAVLAAGGALFMLSDALLASNKFMQALPLSSLWILASYWLAQWCIASWLASSHDARTARNPPAR